MRSAAERTKGLFTKCEEKKKENRKKEKKEKGKKKHTHTRKEIGLY